MLKLYIYIYALLVCGHHTDSAHRTNSSHAGESETHSSRIQTWRTKLHAQASHSSSASKSMKQEAQTSCSAQEHPLTNTENGEMTHGCYFERAPTSNR